MSSPMKAPNPSIVPADVFGGMPKPILPGELK
jgi:hypothetical protein